MTDESQNTQPEKGPSRLPRHDWDLFTRSTARAGIDRWDALLALVRFYNRDPRGFLPKRPPGPAEDEQQRTFRVPRDEWVLFKHNTELAGTKPSPALVNFVRVFNRDARGVQPVRPHDATPPSELSETYDKLAAFRLPLWEWKLLEEAARLIGMKRSHVLRDFVRWYNHDPRVPTMPQPAVD